MKTSSRGGAAKVKHGVMVVCGKFQKRPVKHHVGVPPVEAPQGGCPGHGHHVGVAQNDAAGCRGVVRHAGNEEYGPACKTVQDLSDPGPGM